MEPGRKEVILESKVESSSERASAPDAVLESKLAGYGFKCKQQVRFSGEGRNPSSKDSPEMKETRKRGNPRRDRETESK